MKRPLAYITAAWTGYREADTQQAAQYCRAVYEAGFSPVCPLLYLHLFLNDDIPEEHKSGIDITMTALNIVIFVIVYGRMIEIYLMTSLAPIPLATVVNREIGSMGQNYFRSLLAVGFQGLLIIVCVAIYAVLIQEIATGGDMIGAIWGCVGYTVLLCFTLFKTGSLAKSIFGAH